MRALVAMAILVFGVAGVGAADLRAGPEAQGHASYGAYSVIAEPAAPLIIYDFEPGVTMRAYWLPPWRNRHYFPSHVNYGKRHATPHPAGRPKPAETYLRRWSNDGAYINNLPPAVLRSFDRPPAPRGQNHSTLVKPDPLSAKNLDE
jgi:hypothetical protein